LQKFSITVYDTVLERAPDDVLSQSNKGLALQGLGDAQAFLRQYPEALASYQAAIAACDRALERAPDNVQVQHNKGLALQSLRNLKLILP
jgi:tetratricopeptide (TPR) repeat protein